MIGLAPDSSSSSYQQTYDVFINFSGEIRGEDTLHDFTENMYNALKKARVSTFLDEELRRGDEGDEVTPTLLNAIENSRMGITIFSKNYASSTFCLNALVKIHEYSKRKGRFILPIFYDVKPSEVRHQQENYEPALSMHVNNPRADEDKKRSWKLALHEVSNFSGFHVDPRQDYEYVFEMIVKEISRRINAASSPSNSGLVPVSSSSSYQRTYDVFINFRGEDTRYVFTGNLCNALRKAGVRTFLDDEELRRGDEITQTLLNAIENSRMAITVLSKNYASSTFCLNELVHIHKHVSRKDRLVWPIFYDVDPGEVRYQTGNYEQSLSMHMKQGKANEEKIQGWRNALNGVANLSGNYFNPRQDYEYKLIQMIVKEISSTIDRDVSEYLVGFEPRVKEISSLLQIGSNNKVIMVGICGMGGLGKTTITRALYNSIADNFEGLCFLYDVKGKSMKLGLERIQETIFSTIAGVGIKIQDVDEGVQVLKKRLKEKKILLILDNIDKHEQLKKLAGNCDWFSAGSRIIITTRDEQLLVAHGVESRYNMKVFNDQESLELLSRNAFRNRQVDPHYKDVYKNVLNRAVTYAQGLPLALEVIGSNLCGKTINEWESALDAYKLSLHQDIQQVLRVSYENLEEVEKEIFLDIAFAFNGAELARVKCMVEAVHVSDNLHYSIGVLVDKCLIKIEKCSTCIEMHDLIRDMGRKIVHEESPKNPGERSRLWFHKDIVNVLERNTGTTKVRLIVQDSRSECIEVNWDGEAFRRMKELKILIFKNVKFSEHPKYLPKGLRVIHWIRCPSSLLPPHLLETEV